MLVTHTCNGNKYRFVVDRATKSLSEHAVDIDQSMETSRIHYRKLATATTVECNLGFRLR